MYAAGLASVLQLRDTVEPHSTVVLTREVVKPVLVGGSKEQRQQICLLQKTQKVEKSWAFEVQLKDNVFFNKRKILTIYIRS